MRNVLIVDDSDIDRMLAESLLSKKGFICLAAEDGQQALEKFNEWSIDVVLTDLNMPRMDGLELVRRLREKHPRIPVILTTGVGSEDTAAEALAAGAASYIPKPKLSEMLYPSVRRVLDILDDTVLHETLETALKGSRFEFEFGNEPERLRTLVEFIEKTLRVVSPLDRNDRLRISMSVDQGLHNAVYRGNLEIASDYKVPFIDSLGDAATARVVDERLNAEPYASRKIQVVLEFKPDRFGIRIRDEGPGFDINLTGNWDNPEARGIILMKAFMDKVEYNEKGNDIQLYYYYDRDRFENDVEQAQTGETRTPRQETKLVCLDSGTVVKLSGSKMVVGSRANCHIRLNSKKNVAPLHCMFVPGAERNTWSLVHISPIQETFLNTQRVRGRQPLKPGDVVAIGHYKFELNVDAET